MKILTITTGAVLLAVIGWAYFAHPFRPLSVEQSVFIDKTDTLLSEPDTTEICSSLHLSERTWERTRFSVHVISDVDYNPVYVKELPSEIMLLSNSHERSKKIDMFEHTITRQITSVNKKSYGLPRSSIYLPLIREANKMARSDATKKIIVIYSNCHEFSRVFNAYNKNSLTLLKNNRERTKASFLNAETPADLNGIEVYIVFLPRNEAEGKVFEVMSSLFREILESHGATVHIGANLILEDI